MKVANITGTGSRDACLRRKSTEHRSNAAPGSRLGAKDEEGITKY